jgi:hypothetical protein
MNEVNKTLYIPLYGKSKVSQQGIILNDPSAERIWKEEAFPIRGKSRTRWLAYNMAMRARVFDDWTDSMLQRSSNALVLHTRRAGQRAYANRKAVLQAAIYRQAVPKDISHVRT